MRFLTLFMVGVVKSCFSGIRRNSPCIPVTVVYDLFPTVFCSASGSTPFLIALRIACARTSGGTLFTIFEPLFVPSTVATGVTSLFVWTPFLIALRIACASTSGGTFFAILEPLFVASTAATGVTSLFVWTPF